MTQSRFQLADYRRETFQCPIHSPAKPEELIYLYSLQQLDNGAIAHMYGCRLDRDRFLIIPGRSRLIRFRRPRNGWLR